MESDNTKKRPASSTTQTPTHTPKKNKKQKKNLSAEARQAKRQSDRLRTKTRINIGRAFELWRDLRFVLGIKTDPELAFFLINYKFSDMLK